MTEKDFGSMQQSNSGGTNFQNNFSSESTVIQVGSISHVYLFTGKVPDNLQKSLQVNDLLSNDQVSEALASNPYKGLDAFDEKDAEKYFGRAHEIEVLWNKLKFLYENTSATRFLPITGPSGSGKSSLVRAGLARELNRNQLLQFDGVRVAVIKPGENPLQSLAIFLAQIVATDEQDLLNNVDEFKRILQGTEASEFSGFKRIITKLKGIDRCPLILVIDQFEEIYSYEPRGDSVNDKSRRSKFIAEREAFIENLLYAASDKEQYVSVVVTLRDDFLGEIQHHKAFNKRYPSLDSLFSNQGFRISSMQPEDLESVIIEPAKLARYEDFPQSMVELLVEQTYKQEGGLPLLQFTLQRIWDGLLKGKKDPFKVFKDLGGDVGEILQKEAQTIYDSLNNDEQKIAQRIFMSLVQIESEDKYTRRRVLQSELITRHCDEKQVEKIIERFAYEKIRFLVVSFDLEHQEKTVEISHEALIDNWTQLKEWVKVYREPLRKVRRIEKRAEEWNLELNKRGYLLEGAELQNALNIIHECQQDQVITPSALAIKYTQKSQKKRNQKKIRTYIAFLLIPLLGSTLVVHFILLSLAQSNLRSNECKQNIGARFFLRYVISSGRKQDLEEINLCEEKLSSMNLSKSNFWRSDFRGAILEHVDFQDSMLEQVNFRGAVLISADFSKADVKGANFEKSFLLGTNLEEAIGLTEEQVEKAILCETILPRRFTTDSNRDCQMFE